MVYLNTDINGTALSLSQTVYDEDGTHHEYILWPDNTLEDIGYLFPY